MDSGNGASRLRYAAATTSLAAVPLFATLPTVRLEWLAERCPPRDVHAGATVARFGEPARDLIVVESGTVSATYDTSDGAMVRFASVAGPAVIDKAAVLDNSVHTARWTALTDCRIRLLPVALFRELLDKEPALRGHVLRHLSEQVNRDRRARVRTAASAPVGRVADWIAESTHTHGNRIKLPAAQQGLGEEIGLSRITVNRALRVLADAGAIRVEPRTIVVLDARRLADAARAG